ncbi:Uncharacterised protein [Actinobacillus pleuropneumoniae]|nr:Uncharacterised protein [Actinobacillus pleuropneumoniae]
MLSQWSVYNGYNLIIKNIECNERFPITTNTFALFNEGKFFEVSDKKT